MLKHIVAAVAFMMALAGSAAAQEACEGPWLTSDELDELSETEQAPEYARVRPCAEQGIAGAQTELGLMYGYGLGGIPRDFAEALRWWLLGAEQGNVRAQIWLGFSYRHGLGVPRDSAEAYRWYRLAAEQGDAHAQITVGGMHRTGEGVPQDNAEWVRWYRLAAEQGFAPAQLNLGIMYWDGDGVPQDYVLAHMWFNISAAANGFSDVAEMRNSVARDMITEQIAEAQRLAREWWAAHQR